MNWVQNPEFGVQTTTFRIKSLDFLLNSDLLKERGGAAVKHVLLLVQPPGQWLVSLVTIINKCHLGGGLMPVNQSVVLCKFIVFHSQMIGPPL